MERGLCCVEGEKELSTEANPVDKYFSIVGWPNRKFADLDETGRRLFFRGCDLVARLWLNDMFMPEFDAKNFEGCTMQLHAERYLADRLAYELAPWPKGMCKIEPDDAYARTAVTESTYCVVCRRRLADLRAATKAITCDPEERPCNKQWRNRWKRVKKSYRVTPEEFAAVLKMRRAAAKTTAQEQPAAV
jgi:hypothetical protein